MHRDAAMQHIRMVRPNCQMTPPFDDGPGRGGVDLDTDGVRPPFAFILAVSFLAKPDAGQAPPGRIAAPEQSVQAITFDS